MECDAEGSAGIRAVVTGSADRRRTNGTGRTGVVAAGVALVAGGAARAGSVATTARGVAEDGWDAVTAARVAALAGASLFSAALLRVATRKDSLCVCSMVVSEHMRGTIARHTAHHSPDVG